MVSRYVDEHISAQLRASVLLLLELLFIRDGSFSCSLLSSHDNDELITGKKPGIKLTYVGIL